MGIKVWIYLDAETGDYFMVDTAAFGGSGPIEVSNELFERYMECDREFSTMQGILSMLDYEWRNSEEEDLIDCE